MSFVEAFYSFNLEVSNSDKGLYESLRLKTPQHPDETPEYLFARVLAYIHSYRPGLKFSQGLFEPKDPTIWTHDITGQLLTWIELGCPDLEKIRRALRSDAETYRIYFYEPDQIRQFCHLLRGSKTNWVKPIEFFNIAPGFLADLAPHLRSSMRWNVTLVDETVYLFWDGREYQTDLQSVDIWAEYQRSLEV